jgi:hypothetical protein
MPVLFYFFKLSKTESCYLYNSTNLCKFSNLAFARWNYKVADKIPYSYVRVRFMKKSDDEKRFCAAMSNMCNKKKFTSDELIGVVLLINVSYRSKGEVFVKKYEHTKLNELWFVDDISDEFHWSSGYASNEE